MSWPLVEDGQSTEIVEQLSQLFPEGVYAEPAKPVAMNPHFIEDERDSDRP